MINKITTWWMNLLNGGSEIEVGNTSQDNISTETPVIEGLHLPEPDISEPVLSFVDTVLSDPKRFYFKLERVFNRKSIFYCYDRKFKKGYAFEEVLCYLESPYLRKLSSLNIYHCSVKIKLEDISFLTYSELKFIYDKLVQPARDRQHKYADIKKARKLRDQRSKLTKLYKGEQQ